MLAWLEVPFVPQQGRDAQGAIDQLAAASRAGQVVYGQGIRLALGALDDVYDSTSSTLPGGAQRGSRFSAKARVPSRSSG